MLIAKTLRRDTSRRIYVPDALDVAAEYEQVLADGPAALVAFVEARKQIVREIQQVPTLWPKVFRMLINCISRRP